MSEFLILKTPRDALSEIIKSLPGKYCSSENTAVENCLGRVVSENIFAPQSLPNFPRSTVDGYAVRSVSTFGASNQSPVYLMNIGEVKMGEQIDLVLSKDQALQIHTGGMLPGNADSVVMIEDTQKINNEEIEIRRAVAPGENVLHVGEEIESGSILIPSGTRIRAIEIGGLKALGINNINVRSRPRVGIISSGDELVNPEAEVLLGQIRDVNTYMLSALVQSWGGEPIRYGIIKDNIGDLFGIAKKAIDACDLLVFTAGSSVSDRDVTSEVIKKLGPPGIIVHGINIRPGKPTILAICSEKPVIGLPGNPVSAYVTSNLLVKPIIEFLLNLKPQFSPTIRAELVTNIPSKTGREDWIPVRLSETDSGFKATPIYLKSNFIVSLSNADGFICISAERTGLEVGEIVDVVKWI